MTERTRAARTKKYEHLMLYRELGVEDREMDLLMQLAFISTMSLDSERCWALADALEALHPHHAGAFIVRGLRNQAEGNLLEALSSCIVGVQADIKAKESASICLNMLEVNDLGHLDIAFSLRVVTDLFERDTADDHARDAAEQPDDAVVAQPHGG